MSLIDYFKHEYVANFLDHPVYLPLENFDYQENGLVSVEDIIWRDDSSNSPVIISIRSCIASAIINFVLNTEDRKLVLTKEQRSYTGERDIYNNDDDDWREEMSYYNGHRFFSKYLELEPEGHGDFIDWAKEQIGLFLIRFHPELLTNKEREQIDSLKMNLDKEYPISMTPRTIYENYENEG